jgi:hypothetical protein
MYPNTDKLVKILYRELDSFHIDKDDFRDNIEQICKKNDIHYIKNYKFDEIYDAEGEFMIRLGNSYYVLDYNMNKGMKKSRDGFNINTKLTKMFHHYVQNRMSDFWQRNNLYGIYVTSNKIMITCAFNNDQHYVFRFS